MEIQELWENKEDSLTDRPHEVEVLEEEGEITSIKKTNSVSFMSYI